MIDEIDNSVILTSTNMKPYNKELSRQHMAPKEFTYLLYCSALNSNFIHDLKYINNNFLGNIEIVNGTPYIANGYNKIEDIDVYVVNQIKQNYYYLWFKTKDDAIKLSNIINEKKKLLSAQNKYPIYKFTKQGWQNIESYDSVTISNNIGYDHYINKILKDINNYQNNKAFLKSIGEGSRSLNYLLYGPPGTGKTTLIKTIASLLCLPIYIVNATLIENINISTVLSPNHNDKTNKVIIFEDFDRYLQDGKFVMSEILNELDGISNTNNCIRFFTANNEEIIYKHDALINRMSGKFKYYYPTREHFVIKLKKLLSFYDTEFDNDKINHFIDLITDRNITLRPFTNYVIRYLFEDNVLDKLIDNINELIV